MGQLIMIGSMLLIFVVIVGSVLKFDPEARGPRTAASGEHGDVAHERNETDR